MKSKGILVKNIAAFLLLLALCSLLLPFCKLTTANNSVSISGWDLLIAGGKTGYEYYKEGTVSDDFVIKGDFTFGELKSAMNETGIAEMKKEVAKVVLCCLIPVMCCILAMFLLVVAIGKKSMVLPTLFSLMSFIGSVIMLVYYPKVSELVLANVGEASIGIGLLIGIYAFMFLCGIASILIMVGWFLNMFDYDDDDSDKRKKKRRTKTSTRKKRKTKKKTKKKKKESKDKKDSKKNDSDDESEEEESYAFRAVGKIYGLSGRYKGMEMDLSQSNNGRVAIATQDDLVGITDENLLEDKKVVIEYSKKLRQFKIQSFTKENVVVHFNQGEQQVVSYGNSKWVGEDTLLFIGNNDDIIQLK